MSILLYPCSSEEQLQNKTDKRYERDVLGDMKHGLDLIFGLKAEFEMLHPHAQDVLRRLISY